MGDRGPFKSYATMKKEKELKEGKGIWHVCYLVLWNVKKINNMVLGPEDNE
jgi:hypothetical protein